MSEPTQMRENPVKKASLSDDMVDGIAAVALIAIVVVALVYWLNTLPSS